jgi:hypothetical protein
MAENLQVNVDPQQQEEKFSSQDDQLHSRPEQHHDHHQVHRQKETLNSNNKQRSPTETSGIEQQNETLHNIENPSQNNLLIPNMPPTCMVFAFGSGKLGQLGLEVQEDQWFPSEVLALRNVPIVHMACAGTHSLACTGCSLISIMNNFSQNPSSWISHETIKKRYLPLLSSPSLYSLLITVSLSHSEWRSICVG